MKAEVAEENVELQNIYARIRELEFSIVTLGEISQQQAKMHTRKNRNLRGNLTKLKKSAKSELSLLNPTNLFFKITG